MKLLITVIPTVLLVVTGQIVTKWRVSELQSLAHIDASQTTRLKVYLSDPFIIAAYCLALMRSISWMIVVERYDISIAYPVYIGLSLGAVLIAGVYFFNEPLTETRLITFICIWIALALFCYDGYRHEKIKHSQSKCII